MALRRLLTKRSALKPVVQLDVLHKIFPIRPSEALSQSLDGSVRHLSQAATAFQQNTSFWSSFLKRTSQRPMNLRQLTNQTGTDDKSSETKKSIMVEEEDYSSITDKIPEKPMSATEGFSYTLIILAAFAVLGACLWAFVSNYIWDPVEYTCFNITLEKLRSDPRVTVRVGDTIKGYGSDSMNRRQRHMIRNRQYTDASGTEHTQIQFNIKGTSGVGIVYADMYKDESKKWQYAYLYVDIPERGRNSLQRLAIVEPVHLSH